MTNYQRAKRLHTMAMCGFYLFLFVLVASVGPTLDM